MHLASPLDPYFEAFQTDPLTGLVLLGVGILFLLGPEALLATLYLRPVLARRLRKDNIKSVKAGEWDEALSRVVKPLKEDLAAVKADLEAKVQEAREEVATFYADFAEFSEKLGGDLEALPIKIQMRGIGAQGEAQKVLQTALVEQGQEFESEATMMEAVASQDPEIIIATAMKKVADWTPSEKFTLEHELLAAAAEVGKPFILQKMGEALQKGGLLAGRSGGSGPRRPGGHSSPFGG